MVWYGTITSSPLLAPKPSKRRKQQVAFLLTRSFNLFNPFSLEKGGSGLNLKHRIHNFDTQSHLISEPRALSFRPLALWLRIIHCYISWNFYHTRVLLSASSTFQSIPWYPKALGTSRNLTLLQLLNATTSTCGLYMCTT